MFIKVNRNSSSNSWYRKFYQTLSNFINLLPNYLPTELGTTHLKLVSSYKYWSEENKLQQFYKEAIPMSMLIIDKYYELRYLLITLYYELSYLLITLYYRFRYVMILYYELINLLITLYHDHLVLFWTPCNTRYLSLLYRVPV